MGLTFGFALIWFGSLLIDRLISESINKKLEYEDRVFNEILHRKIEEKLLENEIRFLNDEIFRRLSERNKEIARRVCYKIKPQLKNLKAQTLWEIERYSSAVLERYIPHAGYRGIESFLDWLYSFGTDYMVVFKKLLDTIKGTKCYYDLKRGKLDKASLCINNSKLRMYILQRVRTYLINEWVISQAVEKEILPYAKGKVEEFAKKSIQLAKEEYKEELLKEAKKVAELLKREGKIKRILDEQIDKLIPQMVDEIKVSTIRDVENRVHFKLITLITSAIILKVVTKTTTKVAVKVAEKVTLKVSAKLASAAAGFGAGAAACSWLGPFSGACGVVAGVVAWVSTDVVINKLDEALSRDDMKKEIIKLLLGAKKTINLSLVKEFEATVTRLENQICATLAVSLKGIKVKDLPKMLK